MPCCSTLVPASQRSVWRPGGPWNAEFACTAKAHSAAIRFVWIALALLISQPEEMGPHAIEEIDAGNVVADGVEIPVRLFAPMSTERFPVVGVVHGFLRDGSYQRVMAETFASHGFVAVVPDMPCGLSGCDHDANARQLRD